MSLTLKLTGSWIRKSLTAKHSISSNGWTFPLNKPPGKSTNFLSTLRIKSNSSSTAKETQKTFLTSSWRKTCQNFKSEILSREKEDAPQNSPSETFVLQRRTIKLKIMSFNQVRKEEEADLEALRIKNPGRLAFWMTVSLLKKVLCLQESQNSNKRCPIQIWIRVNRNNAKSAENFSREPWNLQQFRLRMSIKLKQMIISLNQVIISTFNVSHPLWTLIMRTSKLKVNLSFLNPLKNAYLT